MFLRPAKGAQASLVRTWLLLGLATALFSILFTAYPVTKARAAEAGALRMSDLNLEVKPEYDEPGVLVINSAHLINTGNTPYSGPIAFRIPRGANIDMACEIAADGNHVCQLYGIEDKGDYNELSWKASRPIQPGERFPVYLEFYYNPIQGDKDKTVAFVYNPVFPIDQLNLAVYQPLRASNFKLDPPAARSGKAGDGLTTYEYTYNNFTAPKLDLKIAYTKPDNTPSFKKKQQDSNQPGQAGGPVPASSGLSANTAVIVLLVVVLLAVLGMFIYYATNSQPKKRAAVGYGRGSGNRGNGGSHHQSKPVKAAASTPVSVEEEKRRARQALLDGKISEQTYNRLMVDLDKEGKGKR